MYINGHSLLNYSQLSYLIRFIRFMRFIPFIYLRLPTWAAVYLLIYSHAVVPIDHLSGMRPVIYGYLAVAHLLLDICHGVCHVIHVYASF